MTPRIKQILSIQPYQVLCLWNTNEKRVIDFEAWITEAKTNPKSVINKLSNPTVFMSAKLDEEQENIVWPNLLTMLYPNGMRIPAGLDFSPDVLYEMSKPLG